MLGSGAHAAGILGRDLHALEAVLHVVVIEVPGVELLDGRVARSARQSLVPAVECLQRHDAVHQHEQGAERGERVAELPRDEIDELQEARQAELDPHETERTPHAHEERARAATEDHRDGVGEEAEDRGAAVVPRRGTETHLHEPCGRRLEEAADDGAHHENDDGVRLVEAVERHRHEERAETVDGREGTEEQAGAVLVHAGFHHDHVVDRLDDEAKEAAHHEDPEEVEEVELDEALAFDIAAEHTDFGCLAVNHIAEVALQLALLAKRGVYGDGKRDHDDQLDRIGDDARIKTREHELEQDLHDGRGDEHMRDAHGVTAPVMQE